MRIIVFISPNRNSWHYIASDSAQALRELGHEVFILLANKDEGIFKGIEDFKPDFIFTVDNVGLNEKFLEKIRVPVLSWITTEPQVLLGLSAKEELIYLVLKESYIEEVKRQGHKKVFVLPLGVNPRVFRRIPLSDMDMNRYGCAISFAGGCNYDIWYRRHKEGIDRFFTEEVVERLLKRHSLDTSSPIVESLILTLEELGMIRDEEGFLLKKELESKLKEELIALHWAAMSRFRKDVINSIRDFGISLYGDDGWKDLKELPGIKFYPFIEDRLELAKLYNATRINLNLVTSGHLNTSTFNIPSTGAFMLSNYREELLKYFDEEEELACFRDLDELRDRLRFYLNHPEEAKEIARNAKKRVLNEHTFIHRMRDVIRIVEEL